MTEPCYEMKETSELKAIPTKNLVNLMRYYEIGLNRWSYDCYEGGHCQCRKECQAIRTTMANKIREILNTRPHIPNKIEAKLIRQERAAKRFKTTSAR